MKAMLFSISVPKFISLKILGAINKKLYYQGPFPTIRMADVPEPKLPSPEWVKIKTHICGFCGSDQNLIFLKDSPSASPFTSFPCVPGHELSGEIVEAGKDAGDFKVGDRICISPLLSCAARRIDPPCRCCRMGRFGACENAALGNLAPGMFTGICQDIGGGFAPYLVAHKSQLYKLPDEISSEHGALMEPLSVALQAVCDNRPNDSDKVLIIGAGVIGNLIIQSIRALGISCHISVSEPSPFHGPLALKAGADHLISDGDIFGCAEKITSARRYKPMLGQDILMGGFTKIFDCVGHQDTIRTSMRALAGGNGVLTIVGIGNEMKIDPTPMWLKLQTIKGTYGYGQVTMDGKAIHVFELAIRLAREKKVKLDGMLTHKFRLDQFRDMIELNMDKSKNKAVKTAISFM
jgi:threonine dehydrogenase-like Zn-dependent dehydrogenase